MAAGASTVLSSTVVPAIVSAPTNVSTAAGTNAVFTASSSGYPTPAVVWQVSTDAGSTYTDVPGATSATLTIPTTLSLDGGRYRAKFSNSVGFVTSAAATLTVTVPVTVPQVITFPALADTPLDQPAPAITASVDSGLPLTIAAGPASVCTNAGAVLTLVGEGTCTVTVSHPGDATHDPASADRSFTVTAPVVAPQIVTLPVIPDTSVDQSPITLPSVSDAGLPIAYTAGPPTVCSVDGVLLTLIAEGTCTVTATQAGDATHQPASATRSFVVTPKILKLDLVLVAGQSVGGAPVVVEGHGLKPLSPVRIELHSTPILLATVMTDADGSFSTTVNLPAHVAAGSHTVVATGEDPDGQVVTAEEALFVDWSGSVGAAPAVTGYTPISPVRLLDTREGVALSAGGTHQLEIPTTLVPADVTAIAVNVSVAEPQEAGFLTVHPCSSGRPLASALNYAAGETRSNLVVPAMTAGTKLCIYTMSATHVVVDLNGYHQRSADAQLVASNPVRLVDSRTTTSLAAGETVEVQVVGDRRAAAGSSAAALYVAVDGPDAAGFLTVFPCGTVRPWAANLNYEAGETVGNDVLAKIGEGGRVCIYTMSATDLVVDLEGWFVRGSGGGSFRALVPGRFADTRSSTIVEAGQILRLVVTGETGLPAGTSAVSLNVAADRTLGAGFLTVFPCGRERPMTANLNFTDGDTVASHVTAEVGADGGVCIYSSATTHVVVDIEGAYAPIS